MRTIGIIGGMSCESSALYYQWLNEGVRGRLGGLHSAEIILWSVDFARIEQLQAKGEWHAAGRELADIGIRLERAGAEIIILATNTMHKVAGDITQAINVPFLHIADPTGTALMRKGCTSPGLLATAYTMSQPFYAERLRDRFGMQVLVPAQADRDVVHDIIYNELCKGVIREDSRLRYVEIAERLVKRGADSIILGCTEVTLLLDSGNVAVPVFDTARLHVEAAIDAALDHDSIGSAA